jgi:hypothetical protein
MKKVVHTYLSRKYIIINHIFYYKNSNVMIPYPHNLLRNDIINVFGSKEALTHGMDWIKQFTPIKNDFFNKPKKTLTQMVNEIIGDMKI